MITPIDEIQIKIIFEERCIPFFKRFCFKWISFFFTVGAIDIVMVDVILFIRLSCFIGKMEYFTSRVRSQKIFS